MSSGPAQLRELVERLVDGEVRFILVGGAAVIAWGYRRTTHDLDIVPDPDPQNLSRLIDVLEQLDGKVKVREQQVSRFAELAPRAIEADMEGIPVLVCSLEDLLAMKRAANRDLDRADIEALEIAHGEAGEEELDG